MLEREAKLLASPAFDLPDLNGVVKGVTVTAAESLKLSALYYDTADLRLARWGCTLRYRAPEGWTVKLPAPNGGSPGLARHELAITGTPGQVPARATELVRALVRREPLGLVARLETQRIRRRLLDANGARVAEVSDDTVALVTPEHGQRSFREIEVEAAGEADSPIIGACVTRLVAAGASRDKQLPKVVRALGAATIGEPDVVVEKPGPHACVADVVRHAVAASVVRFLRHDPGTVLADDPEDVHQARVALRRLRSDLRTFAPLLDRAWSAELVDQLRWYAALLGEVRDVDVLGTHLDRLFAALGQRGIPSHQAVTAQLSSERAQARHALLEARRTQAFLDMLDSLVDGSREPRVRAKRQARAGEVLGPLVQRHWRRLRDRVGSFGPDPTDENLHELRICAKRARYAAEAAAVIGSPKLATFAHAAARLQDLLGEHHDAVVATQWLAEHAPHSSAAEAFGMGEVAALARAESIRLRAEWPAAWHSLSDQRPRSWR